MKLKDMTTDQLVQEFIPKTIIGTDFNGRDATAELRRRLMQHDDLVAVIESGVNRGIFDAAWMERAKATLARARGEK